MDWSSMLDNPIAAAGRATTAAARSPAACDDWSAAFMRRIVAAPRVLEWRAWRPVHAGVSTCCVGLFGLHLRRC